MSRVYNAYQSFILSRSVSFLLSDECTGYSRFQTHRNLHGSFAKFCSALANDLTLEMTGDSCSEDGEFENDQEHGALNASGLSIHYNKREMFFTNREMIAKRINKTLPHVLCKAESKPTSCVWCCRMKHDQSDPKKHTRHGCTTKYGCPVCMVSLCRVKRFNGMSCHELFHSSKSLVDYCRTEMDAVVHVVPHRNRPPPPTRRARPASDSDEEEESNRRTRSRVTPVVTRCVRRSSRNKTRAASRNRWGRLAS